MENRLVVSVRETAGGEWVSVTDGSREVSVVMEYQCTLTAVVSLHTTRVIRCSYWGVCILSFINCLFKSFASLGGCFLIEL